jgi:pimeloyl-ACP methyl ester carboxylesterase
MPAEPFRIDIPEPQLQDLYSRLRNARWAEDFGNDDWHYGVERGWLQDLVGYWTNEFDWRAQEAAMNRLPHYLVDIDGIPIHFVHVRSSTPNAKAIILSHGWPWTFWDYRDVTAPLVEPADGSAGFDVIVPSLPGYGFSSPLRQKVSTTRVAELWDRLMHDVLGYGRYYAAGGDWGARITGELGKSFPEHVAGIYLTLGVLPGIDPTMIADSDYAPDERWMLERGSEARALIVSHVSVHRTDPQTLAYALHDSPLGLASWIWERRRAWSDCDGDVIGLFGRDDLCTVASVYWLTGTIGTSMRLYRESAVTAPPTDPDALRITVPTAFGIAPKDVVFIPRSWAAKYTDLRSWRVFARGGHFAPAEQPLAVAEEFLAFFRSLG